MPIVTVVGSSNIDMVVKVPHLPKPGETVLGGPFIMAAGGKGANQAVAAARLGAVVYLVARVGNDLFGQQALEGYRTEGIVTDYVFRDDQVASGTCLIMVDEQGQNCLAAAPGANDRLTSADVRSATEAIAASQILVLQLENPVETIAAAADTAHRYGVPVILNPAPAKLVPPALMRNVDILTPNESEAAALAGVRSLDEAGLEKTAQCLLDQGPRAVVITLGSRGALVATSRNKMLVPAFPVRAIDATAAGDAFNGALAVALSRGDELLDAVRFASAVAAISVTRLGAQPSLPRAVAVNEFIGSIFSESTSPRNL